MINLGIKQFKRLNKDNNYLISLFKENAWKSYRKAEQDSYKALLKAQKEFAKKNKTKFMLKGKT